MSEKRGPHVPGVVSAVVALLVGLASLAALPQVVAAQLENTAFTQDLRLLSAAPLQGDDDDDDEDDDDDQFEYNGIVKTRPSGGLVGEWEVWHDRQQNQFVRVIVSDDTEIDEEYGRLTECDAVEVEGTVNDGVIVASEIECDDMDDD